MIMKKCSVCGRLFYEEEDEINNFNICNHVDCYRACGLGNELELVHEARMKNAYKK